jgi:hypothetical protein
MSLKVNYEQTVSRHRASPAFMQAPKYASTQSAFLMTKHTIHQAQMSRQWWYMCRKDSCAFFLRSTRAQGHCPYDQTTVSSRERFMKWGGKCSQWFAEKWQQGSDAASSGRNF